MNFLAAADTTPTGPIPVVVTDATIAMARVKPLPPHIAYHLAILRPHLELMAARFQALSAEIELAAVQLRNLQGELDIAAGLPA